MPKNPNPDLKSLERSLRRAVDGEVCFDGGNRALYSTDASNYRQIPLGAVIPKNREAVLAAVSICRKFQAPVVMRGGGTSLAGQGCNTAVVIDLSKYFNRVLEVNPRNKTARVEPGVILDDLRAAAAPHGLTFGPDPATHAYCTLGGMIGNNSCGVHSVTAGTTADNVEQLEILTYDGVCLTVGRTDEEELRQKILQNGRRGEIFSRLKNLRDRYADLIRRRFPGIPRRVSGYNLPDLLPENGFHVARALTGSESTCVIILEARVNLVHNFPSRSLVVLGYPDIYQAADQVPEILSARPAGLEGFDGGLIARMKKKGLHAADLPLLPPGGGRLLAEFCGESAAEAEARARGLMKTLRKSGPWPETALFLEESQMKRVWKIREAALGASAFVPGEPDAWEGWEDAAVAPESLGKYLRGLRDLMARYEYRGPMYGHFGQGCVHNRINFDFSSREGIGKFRSFLGEAADLVLRHGGSLSGEHGDGQARAELLPKMFGEELVGAFREFKTIWDPEGKMNPGKIVNPYRVDENLRFGPGYRPREEKTRFAFAADGGSFARAAARCAGVGKCRRLEGGTMCPSFMATREERHSTRGRARLLFEMLQGTVSGGWNSAAVKEALDLCLSCKGCKTDCPVNVDMAMYKSEFLSHYYERNFRPPAAFSMGLVFWWARLASRIPHFANFAAQAPGLSPMIKFAAGVSPHRRLPALAHPAFRQWFNKRNPAAKDSQRRQVLLWPDTFNNYFHPETARAAVEVLENAGYEVLLPPESLCCGRPLYDFGMLDLAQKFLRRILKVLDPWIRAGTPVIGLEPSCTAVFRDEMLQFFPEDEMARRLSKRFFTLGEFLDGNQVSLPAFQAPRKVLVHGHCHQKALFGMGPEERLLKRLGLEAEILDSGCCGMAGSFGFDRRHYRISMQIGERVLLPAVRRASPEDLILSDGFSCRQQIAHGASRRALHLAELIRLAP